MSPVLYSLPGGSLFLLLGLLLQTIPVDITSICILLRVFVSTSHTYALKLGTQVSCIILLSLPVEVFLFDREEFNLHITSRFSLNPMLVPLTSADA